MSGTSPAGEVAEPELPSFTATQFDLRDAPECDLIMKGGITSGIVYPYAILQIATRYRLRSIGGTSAGAIAAAFAAAAEFARLSGRPEGFLILKGYCDELPERLSTLFQPTPELAPAFETAKSAIATTRFSDVVRIVARHAAPGALAGAGMTGLPFYFLQSSPWVTGLAAALGLVIGGGAKAAHWSFFRVWRPLTKAARDLRTNTFGVCTGLTMPGHVEPALTDWIHRALQHIAFGDPDHAEPLTFGHLRGPDPDRPSIDLKMVTTNLSMRRPHTLPRLGIRAGFIPNDWERLFPRRVMDWLQSVGTSPWQRYAGAWQFPSEESLPVVVAVRMSLSFPMLFSAVPLKVDDIAFSSIVHSLGGKPRRRIVTALFSDGGISSNFPVHMFDALLPRRPTFAFSLEELPVGEEEVTRRVALPTDARQGMGVHVEEIGSFGDFGWGVLNSAKDWQDQLLSEITGQRERVARIYLTKQEGGLNLDMKPDVSRRLMLLGYEAGCKFTDGVFDFDEHRWRRTLVLYRHLHDSLEHIDQAWSDGFAEWYAGYARRARSFKSIPKHDRDRIARNIGRLLECWNTIEDREIGSQDRFSRKIGRFKIGPDY